MNFNYEEINKKIDDAVLDIFKNNDNFLEYLNFASKFYNKAYENILLIQLQNKNAISVESENIWKIKYDRDVTKGTSCILNVDKAIRMVRINGDKKMYSALVPRMVYDIYQTEGKDIIKEYSMNQENIKFAKKVMENQIDNMYFQNKTEVMSIEYVISKKFDINAVNDKFIDMRAWSSNKTINDLKNFLEEIQYKSRNIINLIDIALIERNKLIVSDKNEKRKTLTDIKNGVELYRQLNDITDKVNIIQNKTEER